MDLRALNRCLQRLSDVLPFVHGQWLIEDPNTWDYRVIAYRVPTGHPQYDTAHRTGVIGQVFRTEKSIVVLDVRNHVLYDPFDEEVGWELALPTRQDDRLTAVLNLEGSGSLELQPTTWHDVAQAIEAETGWRVPTSPPEPHDSGVVATRFECVPSPHSDTLAQAIASAQGIADRDTTVLLVANSTNPSATRKCPTATEAIKQGLPLGECVHGIGRRLDFLALGSGTEEENIVKPHQWRGIANGRYELVLSADAPK